MAWWAWLMLTWLGINGLVVLVLLVRYSRAARAWCGEEDLC